jgi:hypothetical protein
VHLLALVGGGCRCCCSSGCCRGRPWLPYIAASLVIHIGYYIALAGAYQHGDLGLTYPMMRGFGAAAGGPVGSGQPDRRGAQPGGLGRRHRHHHRRRPAGPGQAGKRWTTARR